MCSPVRSFDPISGEFRTFTGRVFRLVGEPGLNEAGVFLWATWKAMSRVFDDRDATEEVIAAMSAGEVQFYGTHDASNCGVDLGVRPAEAKSSSSSFCMQAFGLNRQGRDLAIGDIHGCFAEVKAALEIVQFDRKVDRLFCLGDLIDRGPQSDQVLEWLDEPWLHAIMGNHEQMAWCSVNGIPSDRRFHRRNGGEWLELLSAEEQMAIAERLSALPLVIEVETLLGIVGLVHSDSHFDDWADLRAIDWAQLDDDHPFVRCCLWSPLRFKRQYRRVVRNVRVVIHGHVTVPAVTVLGNTFYIDTGGWLPEGHFTLLNLHTLMPELPRDTPEDSTRGKA